MLFRKSLKLKQCVEHANRVNSMYALSKRGSADARDRRTAIELAIIVEDMARSSASILWVPHGRMVVDILTKADISGPLPINGTAGDQMQRRLV